MSSTPSHQLDPIPESKRSERVQDRAFTLFVDDKRVPGKYKVESDGVEVRVTWVTSVAALDDPNADFEAQLAWGGWKPGDTVHVRQPVPEGQKPWPPCGTVQILSIEIGDLARGQETHFLCYAQTDFFDWENDSLVVENGKRVRVPASWFVR